MTKNRSRKIPYQGIVRPSNSEFCKTIGFTPDKFDGYLWIENKELWITSIQSLNRGKGNMRFLFSKAEELGFTIVVPTPFPHMTSILKRLGFIRSYEEYIPSKNCIPDGIWTLHKMTMVNIYLPLPEGEMVEVWKK